MTMRRIHAACAVLGISVGAMLLAGCAGYCITDEATGKEGYVCYQPYPYLLTTPKVSGEKVVAWEGSIIYLPNYTRPMRVRAWSGLGKANFKFTFKDGWMLTNIEADMDNTKILEAMVGLIPEMPKLAESTGSVQDEARLYRIDFDSRGRACGVTQVSLTQLSPPDTVRPTPTR